MIRPEHNGHYTPSNGGASGLPPSRWSIERLCLCSRCVKEGLGPDEQKLVIGSTKWGLQLYCAICDRSVMHLDFRGLEIPWNTDL